MSWPVESQARARDLSLPSPGGHLCSRFLVILQRQRFTGAGLGGHQEMERRKNEERQKRASSMRLNTLSASCPSFSRPKAAIMDVQTLLGCSE